MKCMTIVSFVILQWALLFHFSITRLPFHGTAFHPFIFRKHLRLGSWWEWSGKAGMFWWAPQYSRCDLAEEMISLERFVALEYCCVGAKMDFGLSILMKKWHQCCHVELLDQICSTITDLPIRREFSNGLHVPLQQSTIRSQMFFCF